MTQAIRLFHAIDPADNLFCHNIEINKGRLTAVSLARQVHPEWDAMRSPYEAFTMERDKEAAFERVRAAHYSNCPPRMGAIFLFPTHEAAERANRAWWGSRRVILPAHVIMAYRIGQFDSKQLNALPNDWEAAARRYWSGATTEDPWVEVLLDGIAQLEGWERYGRLWGGIGQK